MNIRKSRVILKCKHTSTESVCWKPDNLCTVNLELGHFIIANCDSTSMWISSCQLINKCGFVGLWVVSICLFFLIIGFFVSIYSCRVLIFMYIFGQFFTFSEREHISRAHRKKRTHRQNTFLRWGGANDVFPGSPHTTLLEGLRMVLIHKSV